MKIITLKNFYTSICLLLTFILYTILLRFADVQPISANGTSVGLATINACFYDLTGVNMTLYTVTDWLGLVPIAFCLGFAILGIVQWIKRKNLFRVDRDILILGAFYIVTLSVFLFFESIVINYRPILINGNLEASYPSSTTLLTMCVMPTAVMQLNSRIKNNILRKIVSVSLYVFTFFMVIARLVSGVHWLTDIIGGILLSTGLVEMYRCFANNRLNFQNSTIGM